MNVFVTCGADTPRPPCAVCGTPYDKHGTYPTCASHHYTATRAQELAEHAQDVPDPQLCKFYGVTTFPELVAAMERHITKLQTKLPQTPSLAPQRVREG